MLNVDTTRPLRGVVQLGELIAAIEQAEPHDETDWIEWKRALGVESHDGCGHVARHILGMANRDPDQAARQVGGCGYLLLGAEPRNVPGIPAVDPASLEQRLARFLGDTGPILQLNWIRHRSNDVLVVVVDPPRPGDPIHTLRKPFDKYDAGDIFVRRMGATHKAGPADVDRLTTRARFEIGSRGLSVTVHPVDDTACVIPLDAAEGAISSWLETERERLLAPLDTHETSRGEERPPMEFRTSPKALGGDPAEALSRAAETMSHALQASLWRRAEDRSPADYREDINQYLDVAGEVAQRVAVRVHMERGSCRVRLAVTNPTDHPFRDVEVSLRIISDTDIWVTDEPPEGTLPSAPALWNEKRPAVLGWARTLDLDRLGDSVLYPSPVEAGRPWVEIDTESECVTFSSLDLPPQATKPLAEFHVLVSPVGARRALAADWEARSTVVAGVARGTLAIEVDSQVVQAADLLDEEIQG